MKKKTAQGYKKSLKILLRTKNGRKKQGEWTEYDNGINSWVVLVIR